MPAFESLLGHRATIQELVGGKAPFGTEIEEFRDLVTNVPCRVTAPKGRERTTLTGRDVEELTHVLFFEPTVAITEANRISVVKDSAGVTLATDLDIVIVKQVSGGDGTVHHLEVGCRVVK